MLDDKVAQIIEAAKVPEGVLVEVHDCYSCQNRLQQGSDDIQGPLWSFLVLRLVVILILTHRQSQALTVMPTLFVPPWRCRFALLLLCLQAGFLCCSRWQQFCPSLLMIYGALYST